MNTAKWETSTISILSNSSSRSSIGGVTSSWSTASTTKGCINPANGSDVYTAQARNIVADYIAYLSGNAVVTEKNRLSLGVNIYDVVFVDDPYWKHVFLKVFLKRIM